MLNFIKNLFSKNEPTINFKTLVAEGALIIDVRQPHEFANGHVAGSVNIPLDLLAAEVPNLDKNKSIITCCLSGMRSGVARNTLLREGFAEVHNGGGWVALSSKLN